MKKLIVSLLAAFAFAGLAQAQAVGQYLQNDGRINNSVSTYAAANGAGTSLSVARGEASAAASGFVSVVPGTAGGYTGAVAALGGHSQTSNQGMAYNVSTGAGQGQAESHGWADARTFGSATFTAPGQTLSIAGSTDSGMADPVRNGTDVHVVAGTNTDGWAGASTSGAFLVTGYVGSAPIPGGVAVVGGVADIKESTAEAAAGGVTFAGGTPAGQSAATRWANAGTVVNASGSFSDPQ